jgi:1-acyl-sn-glycerol-3-phosphate acyltransferase
MLSGIIIPIICLFTPKGAERERKVKLLIHYTFRCFINTMYAMGVLTYDIDNYEDLNRPGQLILANHPSLLDVVFLIAAIRQADCVVKNSLLSNPFMSPIKMAGYIANEDPEKVIIQAAESLKRGNSLIIFPEGTRTTPNKAITMKRGSANIALQATCNITPVIITCKPTTLTKQHKWYHIPDKRFHVSLLSKSQLNIDIFRQEPIKTVAARKLTHFLEKYFTEELAIHE